MIQLDALRLVGEIRKRAASLAAAENYVRDSKIASRAEAIWSGAGREGGLVSETWIQGAFPSKQSNDSLNSLAKEGLFPADLAKCLDDNDKFPAGRLLFEHQSKWIRSASRALPRGKPSIVVTAGTGAGKTESFLFPILSGLWDRPRRQGAEGMRCLILYPMNALVTDQVTRLYELLNMQQKLSLFHFTSETPETNRQATARGKNGNRAGAAVAMAQGRTFPTSSLPTTRCSNICFADPKTADFSTRPSNTLFLMKRTFTPGRSRPKSRCCFVGYATAAALHRS